MRRLLSLLVLGVSTTAYANDFVELLNTGSSAVDYYPGGLILLQDNVNPTQPWGYDFNLFGSGNASAWGDYMVTQPFEPDVGPFITTEWAVNGSGAVVPHVVIWGRGNEYGYARFKTS